MSDERKQVTKKARLDMGNSAAGPSQIQHSTAAVDQLSSQILKLDVDCFEELFEWLFIAALRALRETCKRLKQVVDYFIRTNYPAVKFGFGSITLREEDFYKIKELDPFDVKMIKDVEIIENKMNDEQIDDLKRILPQLERLQLFQVELETNFYESILKWCTNLKFLSICVATFNKENPDEDNHWLKHPEPTIEHLALNLEISESIGRLTELETFLELNPNIQTFSVDFDIIDLYYNCFFGSNIQIDRLRVHIYLIDENSCDMLNELYEQGFYRRLRLFVDALDEIIWDQITLIRGMDELNLSRVETNTPITLPSMPSLRELCICGEGLLWDVDVSSVTKNLISLERVYLIKGRIDVIIPFIRYAPKLNEMKFVGLKEGAHFKNGIMNLSALNKERKGLAGTCKVTIYVEEHIFLPTKFATSKIEFDLVTLKRAEAVEWVHNEYFGGY